MNAPQIIAKKRDGGPLAKEEIDFLIRGFSEGSVPDYQMSAFLMAVFFRGMDLDETLGLTRAMMNSGKVLDLSKLDGVKVDKHSTGGVGDKVSIVLAPLVAVAGVRVPMVSGRTLGHTGGTLDKLESIPGSQDRPDSGRVRRTERVGFSIAAQSKELVPPTGHVRAEGRDRHSGVRPSHREQHTQQEIRGRNRRHRVRRVQDRAPLCPRCQGRGWPRLVRVTS
jgi:thymidine phosphorylase